MSALSLVQQQSLVPDSYKGDPTVYLELIKDKLVGQNLSVEHMNLLLAFAKRTGLDPLAGQLHAIARWNNKKGAFDMTMQTSIDGFRVIAQRSGEYGGQDDAVFTLEETFNPVLGKAETDFKATVTVYKVVKGVKCTVVASARWKGYVQKDKTGKPSGLWATMPHNQLAKCAEALALRKAFPNDLSGLYTDDEMGQADRGTIEPDRNAVQSKPPVSNVPADLKAVLEPDKADIAYNDMAEVFEGDIQEPVPTPKPKSAAAKANRPGYITGQQIAKLKELNVIDEAVRLGKVSTIYDLTEKRANEAIAYFHEREAQKLIGSTPLPH